MTFFNNNLFDINHVIFNIKIITIGLQPGENMHEKILKEGPYSNEVAQYTIDEIVEMV